jgi:hypothetical protein
MTRSIRQRLVEQGVMREREIPDVQAWQPEKRPSTGVRQRRQNYTEETSCRVPVSIARGIAHQMRERAFGDNVEIPLASDQE